MYIIIYIIILCTGILLIINPSISFLWIIFVAVMFWKLVFPSNSLRYRYLDKWIHTLTPLISEHNYYTNSIYHVSRMKAARPVFESAVVSSNTHT